eukprot:Sspe_Gene.90479::Locus_62017_Transcript_1_1_Confidence_1.000_Length_1427::g.90479::m.90479
MRRIWCTFVVLLAAPLLVALCGPLLHDSRVSPGREYPDSSTPPLDSSPEHIPQTPPPPEVDYLQPNKTWCGLPQGRWPDPPHIDGECRSTAASFAQHTRAVADLMNFPYPARPIAPPRAAPVGKGTVTRLGEYFYEVRGACISTEHSALRAASWAGEVKPDRGSSIFSIRNEFGRYGDIALWTAKAQRGCYSGDVAVLFNHWSLYPVNLGHSFHRTLGVFNLIALLEKAGGATTVVHLFSHSQWKFGNGVMRNWWPFLASTLTTSSHAVMRDNPNLLQAEMCFDHLIVGWVNTRWKLAGHDAEITNFRRMAHRVWNVQYFPPSGPKLHTLLVDRRHSRAIINSKELSLAAPRDAGLRRVLLEDLCFRQQATVIANTDILIGLTGSALIWAGLMCPASVVVQFSPPALGGDIKANGTNVNPGAEMAVWAGRAGLDHIGWTIGPPPSKFARRYYSR